MIVFSGITTSKRTEEELRIAVFIPDNRAAEYCGALIFSAFLLRAAASVFRSSEPVATQNRGHFGSGLLAALFNPVMIPFFVSFFLGHPNLAGPWSRYGIAFGLVIFAVHSLSHLATG